MKQKLRKKWLTALRDGSYTQTKNTLRRDGCFCVLGVLHDVAGGEWIQNEEGRHEAQLDESCTSENLLELDDGTILYDLDEHSQESLYELNDGGASFRAIAEWIEENIEVTP